MTRRIGINGFGRIGRNILRAWLERKEDHLAIVHINDMVPIETLAHLLRYDSVHGRLGHKVTIKDHTLLIDDDIVITVSQERDPAKCPWGEKKVDTVFECTGFFTKRQDADKHRQGGAKKVLISAPGKDVDATIVYGVNHHQLTKDQHIVSNASCTTNCLAPMVLPLYQTFGIESGLMTTIHAYTNDQQVTDAPHPDLRRARAAAQSMIPTKTGAAAAIGLVIPELMGKLDGFAMRVPIINVSVVDLTFQAQKPVTVESVNDCLIQAAQSKPLSEVMIINQEPLVSIDFNHHPASSICDVTQTRVVGNTVKVLAWYDNEWGFSNRMLDTAKAWAETESA